MASYHLKASVIKRSIGRSATAAAAYRAGERIEDNRTGDIHDYSRKRGVEHTEILTPSDAPDWAKSRSHLWNAAEIAEKRKDAQVAREITLSLPHELTEIQRRDLVRTWAQEHLVSRGMVADIAHHAPGQEGDQRNHHAHIMVTTRHLDAEGFGKKNRDWNAKEILEDWRESWAEAQNRALERAGEAVRVDHRSLEAQRESAEQEAVAARGRGEQEKATEAERTAEMLNRAPEPRLGPAIAAVERKAKREAREAGREYQPVTERGAELVERREERRYAAALLERLDSARAAYAQARDSGASRTSSTGAALQALVQRSAGLDRLKAMRDARRSERQAQEQERAAAPASASSDGLNRLKAMVEARDREKAQERQRALEAAAKQARARLQALREAKDRKQAQERENAQQAEKAKAAKQKAPPAKVRRRKIDRDIDL